MKWIKKYKLPAIEAIEYNSWPYLELEDLWQALHSLFNLAQSCRINLDLLEEIQNKPVIMWRLFYENEFKNVILKCNNSLTLESDKLSWKHLKVIINNKTCLEHFINIANVCINLEHWLSHFKTSNSIIILKPNKTSYNSPKMFRLIILLNMLGKLIEKIIDERLQFQSISKNFIYSY